MPNAVGAVVGAGVGAVVGAGVGTHSVQAAHPDQPHFFDQVCVWPEQYGLHRIGPGPTKCAEARLA